MNLSGIMLRSGIAAVTAAVLLAAVVLWPPTVVAEVVGESRILAAGRGIRLDFSPENDLVEIPFDVTRSARG